VDVRPPVTAEQQLGARGTRAAQGALDRGAKNSQKKLMETKRISRWRAAERFSGMRAACAAVLAAGSLAGCAATPNTDITTGSIVDKGATALDERIAYYAQAYEVPEALIRRSIQRESGYNPKARNGPYWGLMQIRLDTARGMGYRGTAQGLLDADTNLKYAVAYLANAYVVAEANPDRAIRLYASGYYWEARRKGVLDKLKTADSEAVSSGTGAAEPSNGSPRV
jgi:soluble lytic murein transglycosylase-like protein